MSQVIYLARIHGNWCGPGWTGGENVDAADYKGSWNRRAVDKLDAACRKHDKGCSKGGCCQADDAKLIKSAMKIALNPINILFRPAYAAKAQAVATGISLAQPFRKC